MMVRERESERERESANAGRGDRKVMREEVNECGVYEKRADPAPHAARSMQGGDCARTQRQPHSATVSHRTARQRSAYLV